MPERSRRVQKALSASELDPGALFCVVALCPERLSRNRYFALFTKPEARMAHKRAHVIRRLAFELQRLLEQGTCVAVAETKKSLAIAYRDNSVGVFRRVVLHSLEGAVLRCLLGRGAASEPLALREEDWARVQEALGPSGRDALGSGELGVVRATQGA